MRIQEIITEAAAVDEILAQLQNIGLDNVEHKNSRRLIVYVKRQERNATIKVLLDRLPGATYNKAMTGSSLGGIEYNGVAIMVKPKGGTGAQSAGLSNEKHLVDTINRFVDEVGPLIVTFVGDNGKSITARNVDRAASTGADSTNRSKSDVMLFANGKPVPLSLKKSNAEYWESADSLWGKRADALVDRLVAEGKITLEPIGKQRAGDGAEFVKIKPEVAVKATPEETMSVVFGNDIQSGHGAVVKQTFEDEHYRLEDNHLTVTADLVIVNPEDIPENLMVHWLIRNDSSRNRPKHKYPGLRILAAYASRLNKTTLVIK